MGDAAFQTIYGWTSQDGGRTWDGLGAVSITPGQFRGLGGAEPDLAILEVKPRLKVLLSFARLLEITFAAGSEGASVVALEGYQVVEQGGDVRSALSVNADSDLVAVVVCAESYWPSNNRRRSIRERANLLTVSHPGVQLDHSLADHDPEIVSGTFYSGGIVSGVIVGDTAIIVQRLSRDKNAKGSEQYAARVPIRR
jgi:hypothetical protein